MSLHMLDTNAVSQLLRGHPRLTAQVLATPMAGLCISVITEAELHYGLAKRPEATQLRAAVHEFLRRVETLAWDSQTALTYGQLRAALESAGRPLAALDTQIAAHALASGATLVTADRAFTQVAGLKLADWTA